MLPPDGIILADKPRGVSSFSVVAQIRRELGQGKKIKVGHAGTLDPFATGLLIVLVGKATRIQRFLMALPKRYLVRARLGWKSTTGDPEGEISQGHFPAVSHLPTGKLRQRPPAYSAIKIGGERAYKLARKGKEFAIPEREISVYRFDQIAQAGEKSHFEKDAVASTTTTSKLSPDEAEFIIECSAGTYIRSLIADLSDAYCTELRREKIGSFSVKEAAIQKIIPISKALDFLPKVSLSNEQATAIRHGRSIPLPTDSPGTHPELIEGHHETLRLVNDTKLVALAEVRNNNLKPIVGFQAK